MRIQGLLEEVLICKLDDSLSLTKDLYFHYGLNMIYISQAYALRT